MNEKEAPVPAATTPTHDDTVPMVAPKQEIDSEELENDDELGVNSGSFSNINRNNAFDSVPAPTPSPTVADNPIEPTVVEEKKFEEVWAMAFEAVYKSNHFVYGALKDTVPIFNDGVAFLSAKNDFQKEQVLGNTRGMVRYFKDHSNIELRDIDIKVEVEDIHTMKKQYLDDADKIKILRDTNPELIDFVKILGLQIEE